MAVVDVLSLAGTKVGTVELADDVFSAPVNQNLLHEAVRHHLAGLRSGTHKTKDKSEVSGAGRKLWKQKGTGRARIGSIRSPLWRHGGTVHGPVPRKYDYALPKKMITGALRSALSSKMAQEKLTVVEGWQLDSHKTKPFSQALRKLDKDTRTILLVGIGANENLERASRNIEGVTLVPANALVTYDLMRHDRLMLSKEAAEKLSRALSLSAEAAPASSEAGEGAPAKKAAPAKAEAKKSAAKAAKKPAAAKSAKPKAAAKPKAKKD
jgi:large subunit ribosomal protein L4